MKYSLEEYKTEYEKVCHLTFDGNKRDELMKPFRVKLHQGLEVGDGVTVRLWSDCHASTISRITAKCLFVKRDHAQRIGQFRGMCDSQEYEYTPDPNSPEVRCNWSEKRGCYQWCGKAIGIGRDEYYDFSF